MMHRHDTRGVSDNMWFIGKYLIRHLGYIYTKIKISQNISKDKLFCV